MRWWARLAFLFLFALPLYGQGYRYDNFVLKPLPAGGVTPVSGALITVCTSAGTGTPCTPKVANIYSDEALTVPLTGTGGAGTTNSDANGNFGFYLAPGSYVVTVTGSGVTSYTIKITLPCAGTICSLSTDTRLNNVGTFNVEEWVGTSQYPTLASAIAAATPSTLIRLPCGTWQISGTQNITTSNLKIIGDGADCAAIQITSATANFFSVQAAGFELGNVTLNSSVTRTAGFVAVNGSSGSSEWYFHDLKLTDTYGGFSIVASTGAVAQVTFRNISHKSSVGLHSGSYYVIGGGTSAVSDIHLQNIITPQSAATFDAPQVILDTAADTINIQDYDVGFSAGVAQTQNVVKFQNSAAGVAPKFIRIQLKIEGGGATSTSDCVNIVQGADIRIYASYIANCGGEAINISGGTNINGPIEIDDSWIGNNQKGGIYISTAITASAGIHISGNTFNANSINTTNTFDDIQVAAGTVGFAINDNHFGNNVFSSANKSRYGINLLAGANSNYTIVGNTCDSTQFGTACINDATTGNPTRVVFDNRTSGTAAMNMSCNPVAADNATSCTLSDQAGRAILIRSGGSVTNGQIGSTYAGDFDLIANGSVGGRIKSGGGSLVATLHISNLGTACANGNFALSAGWGTTATVTAAAGFAQTCQVTITSSGTGQAANPTITYTLANALPAATTVCTAQMVGGTGANTLINQTTLSATAPIFTFGGTPVAASTYFVVFRCGP